MKHNHMRRLFILLLILTSCRTTETITKTVIEKDTVYQVKLKDTTILRTETLWKTPENKTFSDTTRAFGRYSSAEAWVADEKVELRLREGKSAGKDTVYLPGKYVYELDSIIVSGEPEIVYTDRPLTWFDKVKETSFFILCFLALVGVIFVRFRR